MSIFILKIIHVLFFLWYNILKKMFETNFPEEAVEVFLRTHTSIFTPKLLQQYLWRQGYRTSARELPDYLDEHPLVFPYGTDAYISRAGIFTNRYFSIKPEKFEITSGILVIAERCMPFCDPEMLPHELQFFYEQKPIAKKCTTVLADDVLDLYQLFGEEYIPQYIALDPANEKRNFAENDYEIPNRIDLLVCDMDALYKKWEFAYTDRLLARITDWNKGYVEIIPLKQQRRHIFERTEEDEKRSAWYGAFEKALLTVIEKYGPCASIEEQLACAYFENAPHLFKRSCGSAKEYFEQSQTIGFETYGVETRLWKKGEDVPAQGLWNDTVTDDQNALNASYAETGLPMPEFIVDAYIYDALYQNDGDTSALYKRIVPETCLLEKWQSKTFLLHIEARYAILAKTYNRFSDFQKAGVRSDALRLYSALLHLMCALDSCGLPIHAFPQQDLVILSQLFAHAGRLIEVILYQEDMSDKELDAAAASLDGMYGSFEDIEENLTVIMRSKRKDAFSVIK